MCHITFPDDENVLGCIVSSSHFCRLDTALHLVDGVESVIISLFEDDKEKTSKYCQMSILNQTSRSSY